MMKKEEEENGILLGGCKNKCFLTLPLLALYTVQLRNVPWPAVALCDKDPRSVLSRMSRLKNKRTEIMIAIQEEEEEEGEEKEEEE